jgi:alpha-glucosidase
VVRRRPPGRDAEHRDFYVWRTPPRTAGPPNNWVSHFGGPAWTLDEATGQYYMHLFLPEQPDLNWENEAVRDAFDRHPGDTGSSAASTGSASTSPTRWSRTRPLPDNPLIGRAPARDASPQEVFAAYEHRHDLDQPGVLEIYERLEPAAAGTTRLLLGEVYLLEPERLARYVEGDALHTTFCFPALKVGWDADEIRDHPAPQRRRGGDGDLLAAVEPRRPAGRDAVRRRPPGRPRRWPT